MAGFQMGAPAYRSLAAFLDAGGLPRTHTHQQLLASKSGDITGQGRHLIVELHGSGGRKESALAANELTLRIREASKTLASINMAGTSGEIHVVDFAGDGHPFIVVVGTWQATSNHAGFAECFRFVDGNLQRSGRFVGFYGAAQFIRHEGRPLIRIFSLYTPKHAELPFTLLYDLIGRHAPSLRRVQTIGWNEGKLDVLTEEVSRRAYRFHESRAAETPLLQDAVTLVDAAESYMQVYLVSAAIAQLQEALALVPDYPDALCALAKAYGMLERWTESRDAAQQAVKLNPWHGWAQFYLGMAQLKLSMKEEAERTLQIAAALQPEQWEPHHWLGVAREQLGALDQALEQYAYAAQLGPQATDRLRFSSKAQ